MGLHQSKYENPQSIKNKLRNLPFQQPTERDFTFLAYLTGLERDEVMQIFNDHLKDHPDGRMNSHEFCILFHKLRKESPEIVEGLSENVFKALGVEEHDVRSISLNEFLMIYALTSRGDLNKRLEYAFDFFDTNRDNALDLDEVREIVYGILELFDESKKDIEDIAKETVKSMKVHEIVRKSKLFLEHNTISLLVSIFYFSRRLYRRMRTEQEDESYIVAFPRRINAIYCLNKINSLISIVFIGFLN